MIDVTGITFLDIGASKGDSMKWASSIFGGRGVGVDIDPGKIAQLQGKGHQGIVADASSLDVPDNSVKFVLMSDFLEHLPNEKVAVPIIKSAVRVASDFVLIRGPDFGGGAFLKKQGLAKYYANWSGHTWHHTAEDFIRILSALELPYVVTQRGRIHDSFDSIIKPIDAVANAGAFNPERDKPKPYVLFSRPRLHQRLACVVVKSGKVSIEQVLARSLVIPAECRLPRLYTE